MFRVLFFSTLLSIFYDFVFLLINIKAWWVDELWDGQIEQGLRQFAIVLTIVLMIWKVVLTILYWHTSVSYVMLIIPHKERIINLRRAFYRQERERMRTYRRHMKYGDSGHGRRDSYGDRYGYDGFDTKDGRDGRDGRDSRRPGSIDTRRSRISRTDDYDSDEGPSALNTLERR
jgi:hypothetical protein